ncbi:MAG: diguanylate cyclase [Gammaproteobacteria bacterium]
MQIRKTRFVIAITALLVVGFMATSLISYFVAHDALSERIQEETLPLTSDNIYSEIQRDLLRSILISSLMSNDTFVRDWAVAGEQDAGQIIRYLESIQKKYSTITAFYVSDKTLNYYHPTGIIKQVDAGDPADDWYFRARQINDDYEINIDDDTADRSRISIFINYRVKDYNGNFIGVTGVGLAVNAVADLIETYQRRYGRQIYFVDREGAVMLHGSDFDGQMRLHERPGLKLLATQILTNPGTAFSYQRPDGHRIYLNSRLVSEFNWHLIVEQDERAAEARIHNTLIINILVSLAITALVLLIAHYTVRGYQRRLEEMATTDKLTGAANRQVFDMIFDQTVKLSKRNGEPISIITLDIDRFKEVNDTYGHEGGDTVIRKVADVMRRHIREADTLCRWGGEEFLLLLADCKLESARERAERLRLAIKEETMRFGRDDINITISLGVAEYQPGESLNEIINRADTAMYEAKRQGRDQVCSA